MLLTLYPDRIIPDSDLVALIEDHLGTNKETVRAYRGYSGHIRAGRCGDNKIVGLSRKGYFERLGFMHPISQRRWVIHAQATLSSQGIRKDVSGVGDVDGLGLVSNEKIFISTNPNQTLAPKGKGWEGKPILEVSLSSKEREEEEDTEKEIFSSPMICPKILGNGELSVAELAILGVTPQMQDCTSGVKQQPSKEKEAV